MLAVVLLLNMAGLCGIYRKIAREERGKALYYVTCMDCGSFLLLTPVVHPWYVCWIVPLLVIVPNRAWIFFSGAVFSYLVLRGYVTTGVWVEDPLVKLAQYLPFYGLLLYDAGRWLAEALHIKRLVLNKVPQRCGYH